MGRHEVITALERIGWAYNLHPEWAKNPPRQREWIRHMEAEEPRQLLAVVDKLCAELEKAPTVRDIKAALDEDDRPVGAGGGHFSTGAEACERCDDGQRELVTITAAPDCKRYSYTIGCDCPAGAIRQQRGALGWESAIRRVRPGSVYYLSGSTYRVRPEYAQPGHPWYRHIAPVERGLPPRHMQRLGIPSWRMDAAKRTPPASVESADGQAA